MQESAGYWQPFGILQRSGRIGYALLRGGLLLLAVGTAGDALAQLNENCTISVLNRNIQVKPDGTWVLPNIPARVGLVRARAVCVQDGITTYGQSDFFTVPANDSVTLPPIPLGETTPIPTSLVLTAPTPTLTALGATMQLRATGTYSGGLTVDLSAASKGTSYTISNPGIATVSSEGVVTAVSSGMVAVQATNEGSQGIVMLRVEPAGADSDGDGIPDEVEARLGMDPRNSADALLDDDHDGLTALEEYRLGTDPRRADTDGDGISDGDEAKCLRGYCTNPLLADTDGDGVRDGTEIQTGSDPTQASSYNLAAALRSIQVAPTEFTLSGSGSSIQLIVTGTMIDGFSINLSSTQRQTTYSSSNVAACRFGGADGVVIAGQPGGCTLTIRNNGLSTTANGLVKEFSISALSSVSVPGTASAVALGKEHAFVAAGAAGLQVVSLSADRRTPRVVAALSIGGSARDITLNGNIAYVAAGSAGLKVIDVANPLAPRLLGSFATNFAATAVKVRGITAYVGVYSSPASEVQIINVANPEAMAQIGRQSLGVYSLIRKLDLDLTRSLLAVAGDNMGLRFIDVSNGVAPVILYDLLTYDGYGWPQTVSLRGNYAYVLTTSGRLLCVDISDARIPRLLSTLPGNLDGQVLAVSGNFALGSSSLQSSLGIVDITNPADMTRRGTFAWDDRSYIGTGIAVDGRYVYLTQARSSGLSRLVVGQHDPTVDPAGEAPVARITEPSADAMVFEGAPLNVTVDASDDLAVAAVQFFVNGDLAFTSTAPPYRYSFRVPPGVGALTLGARAVDLGRNVGVAADVVVSVAPDPLTRVIGRVLDETGSPVAGAVVAAPAGLSVLSDADGHFSILGVPTVLGSIVVHAHRVGTGGRTDSANSNPMAPTVGGVTDVGNLNLIDARFEPDFGKVWTVTSAQMTVVSLPFSFPFNGNKFTGISLLHNGEFVLDVATELAVPRPIWPFRTNRIVPEAGERGAAIYIHSSLPGQLRVTYDRVGIDPVPGANTLQVQLFADGRIVLAYKDIVPLTGNQFVRVGYSVRDSVQSGMPDLSHTPQYDIPGGVNLYESFSATRPFDLAHSLLIFTPFNGGYRVRVVQSPPSGPVSSLTGALSAPAMLAASSAEEMRLAAAPPTLERAEVYVRSSGNSSYLGMTNTDAQGKFSLNGVPAGAVSVEVRRSGLLIGRGAGRFTGTNPNEAQLLHVEVQSAELQPGNTP